MGLAQEMQQKAGNVGMALGKVVLDELEGEGLFWPQALSSSFTFGRIAQFHQLLSSHSPSFRFEWTKKCYIHQCRKNLQNQKAYTEAS